MYTTKTNPGTRTSAAAVVIAGHAAVIYALAVTMGVVEAPPIVEPIKAVIIDSPPAEPEPYVPPETPQVAQQPVVDVPLPDIPPITDAGGNDHRSAGDRRAAKHRALDTGRNRGEVTFGDAAGRASLSAGVPPAR